MPDSAHTGTPHGAVFLSYASQDADAARRISEALRSHGVEVWFDADGGLEHGDAWDSKIRQQIKECLLFIPIISSSTQARHEGYFRIEWDLAAERARGIASGVPFILPVVTDETSQAEALVPDRFRSVQWTTVPGGVVTPDYLARFLKLWSHRSGLAAAISARPTEASASGGVAAGPPQSKPKGMIGRVLIALSVVIAAVAWLTLSRRGPDAPKPPVAAAPAPSQPSVGQNSVAVLAFENLSDDKGNEYFSDGISEELLNVLSKIPGLRVAARTSAFSFKGKNATAQEIGAKLGVANLVEGSVRRAGSSVRIAARLSRAETGEQLWSESYTRDLEDVFAVQTELAQTIVEQLRNRLGVSVTYVLSPGRITRTETYTPKTKLAIAKLAIEFATYSDGFHQNGSATTFSEGAVRSFAAKGYENCEAKAVNGDSNYQTPTGPFQSRVVCTQGALEIAAPMTFAWTLTYQ